MSFDDPATVQRALFVLCKASESSLRPYWTKVREIVHKLQPLVEDHDSIVNTASLSNTLAVTTDDLNGAPSSSVSHRSPLKSKDPSAHYPDQRNPPQSPSSPHRFFPVAPSPIETFIAQVDEDLEKIEKYLAQVYCEAIKDKKIWIKDDDPRAVDLAAAYRNPSPMAKFRRGLSQRSLATEFDKWEQTTYETSKVKQLTIYASESSRKLGHITEFVDKNKHRFHDRSMARAGIAHGIKLLVCETILSGIGFSAIFIFEYSRFRSVKFEDLYSLKDAVRDANKIQRLADQKADWLECCQRNYDGEWLLPSIELANGLIAWSKSMPHGSHSPQIAALKRRHSSGLRKSYLMPVKVLNTHRE